MPFVNPSVNDIRDDFLRDLKLEIPGASTAEGSDYFATAFALANTLAPVYANGAFLARQAFPRTADEKGVRQLADMYGVPQLGLQYASGQIAITASFPTTIADGTPLSNLSGGVHYKTVGITTIGGSLSGTANVQATTGGIAGNAESGAVLTFDSAPSGINPQATVVSISDGDEAWTIARWAAEIQKVIQARPGSGNVAHLLALATAVGGVEQAFVYPCLRRDGTIDIIVVTSAASGSRVAGTAVLGKVFGALQSGIKAAGGIFVPGIPEDVFRNTRVSAAVAQSTDVVVGYKASANNGFASWPRAGSSYVTIGDPNTWYRRSASSSKTAWTIGAPIAGALVAPAVGNTIGVFFPSVGFCKGTIATVAGSGPWTVAVASWSPDPSETLVPANAVMVPWCSQLPLIAGAPTVTVSGSTTITSKGLSGAIPSFFSTLGPGEMTALTSDDVTRRRRWPKTTDTSLLTGLAAWPTDVNARLASSLAATTDAADFTVTPSTGFASTPAVPSAAYLGAPPSILTLGTVVVIPVP